MKYKEFEDIEVPVELQGNGWKDTSWHNDVTASSTQPIEHPDLQLEVQVWVWHDDQAEREFPEAKKFMVVGMCEQSPIDIETPIGVDSDFVVNTDEASRLPAIAAKMVEAMRVKYRVKA